MIIKLKSWWRVHEKGRRHVIQPVPFHQVPAKAMSPFNIFASPIFQRVFVILFLLVYFGMMDALAQANIEDSKLIKITGKVHCINPINGAMSIVVIYNRTRDIIAISRDDGSFSINMGRYDTLIFSSPEHLDYTYQLPTDDDFQNKNLNVFMKTDGIWLDVVTIVGYPSIEKFKMAVMNNEISATAPEIYLPEIDKYIKQNTTGDGEFDLKGPFTYLHEKFSRYKNLKKKSKK